MSLKWMWNGAPFARIESATFSTPWNVSRLDEAAVGDRVQVGEVDHRPHPLELGGDREHVLGGAELADAAHHLDAERDAAALALEALAQLAELLDDRGERVLPLAAEQEARVDDDELGAAGDGDARPSGRASRSPCGASCPARPGP